MAFEKDMYRCEIKAAGGVSTLLQVGEWHVVDRFYQVLSTLALRVS